MAVDQVVPGLWRVPLGFVNAYLLDAGACLILVDTGTAGSAGKVLEAVAALGRRPADVRQIVVTHCHSDHAGSLAELKRQTGAPAAMHAEDAALVRAGEAMRPVRPTPGALGATLGRLLPLLAPKTVEPAAVEREVGDGETVPDSGGLRAIHAPGHCAGQLALLWPHHGGVLIAADAAANVFGLGLSPIHEDLEVGRRSLARLAAQEFAVACFGHGRPITSGAAGRFRQLWPPVPDPARA